MNFHFQNIREWFFWQWLTWFLWYISCLEEAIAQFQEKESVQIRSIETANSQIANGVYYRIRLELDQSEQIELIMLDHEEPHFMWLPRYCSSFIHSFILKFIHSFIHCIVWILNAFCDVNYIVYFFVVSDDPRSESGQEMRPLLPRIEFRGPMELIFPASREVRMKLPRYVDAGSFRKLILEKVTINFSESVFSQHNSTQINSHFNKSTS
jgi:hypothetical protein